MKINFLGDSITRGVGASVYENCYVKQVEAILGCEVCNFGANGTRIATQRSESENLAWDEQFMLRAVKMEDADFVFVLGGTNDYGHGDAMLGKMGDTSEYTFYGALDTLVKYLVGKYGKEKLCFVLPIPRYNQDSIYGSAERKRSEKYKDCDLHPLRDYIEAEISVLSSYGIKYLDISDSIPEPNTNGPSELFVDGLHPSDAGHRLIAERVAEYVKAQK